MKGPAVLALTFAFALAQPCANAGNPSPTAKLEGAYTATAYSQQGTTASGDYVHRHVVAADPDILPIGSRIKVRRAGRYSGEYVVADTGEKIQGRRLDIFIPDTAACKRFGRQRVRVRVISLGNGTHAATKQADLAVKQDVKQDLVRDVVGDSATNTDWAVKHAEEKKGVPTPIAVEKAASAAAPTAAPAAATDAKKNTQAPPTSPP